MNFLDLIGPSLAAGAKMANRKPKPGLSTPSTMGRPSPEPGLTPPSVSDIQLREDDVLNGLRPPQQAQGMSGRDVLPVAGLAILASLLGAKNRDINQGFSAFQGIRNQQAEQKNHQANQGYEQNRQRAQIELGRLDDERKGRMREFEYKRGQRDENRRDLRNFDQQQTLAKQAQDAAAAKAELDRKTRETIATGKDRVTTIKTLLSKASPEARAQILLSYGEDPGVAEAMRQLNVDELNKTAKTETENATRQGKVDKLTLDNEFKTITNKHLADKLTSDIAYKNAMTAFVGTKDRLYPDMIAAIGADRSRRLDIQEFAANNASGNAQFDNEVKAYETQTKDERDTLKAELGAINTQRTKLTGEIAKSTDDDEKAALGEQLARLNNQHAKKTARLKAIADGSPVFKAGDGVGLITPRGSRGGFAPMGVSMPSGVPNPALTPAQRAQGDAAVKRQAAPKKKTLAEKEAEMKKKGWK